MSINSRNKGASAEREAAGIWNKYFPTLSAIRGQQRSGVEQADVVGVSDKFHIEVKRRKKFSLWNFIEQIRRDKKEDQIGVLMFRPDGDTDWWIAVSMDNLYDFANEIVNLKE